MTESPKAPLARACGFGIALCLLLEINSVLRGIRFPGIWAYTHYLFNYDQGFIRRGLIGAIVRLIDIPILYSYRFFAIYSLTILLINLLLLSRLMARSIKHGGCFFIWPAMVFSSSMGVVFLAHIVGYSDQIGLLFTLAVLNIGNAKAKFITALIGTPLCLLIHEAFFIIYFPILAFTLLTTNFIPVNTKYAALLIYGILTASITLFLINSTTSPQISKQEYTSAQSRATAPLRRGAFAVFSNDSAKDRVIMDIIWHKKGHVAQFIESLSVTIPSALLIMAATVIYLLRNEATPIAIVLALAASLSPLTLHIVAWDMHRFNALSILTAYLVFLSASSYRKKHKKTVFKREYLLHASMVICSIANLFLSIPLFDSYQVKQFPYKEHIDYLSSVAHGENPIIEIPRR